MKGVTPDGTVLVETELSFRSHAMKSFLAVHGSEIKGVLSGWDRLRLRGTLRLIANLHGMRAYLALRYILLKHFKDWAMGLTDQVRRATERIAEAAGRPIEYLASSQLRKEERAREIAERDRIASGLICVLTCVEPCRTFEVGRNAAQKRLELRMFSGKCLHQYFYLQHPLWGLMHLRLQTWLPFTIHVCLNGREWLANQLRQGRIGYVKRDNCFVDLANPARAQELFSRQLQTDWPRLLNGLVRQLHPTHRTMFGKHRLEHYWSADETEWATDVMFRSPEMLARIYPGFVRHAMTNLDCVDILRFFGRPAAQQQYRAAQLQTNLKKRHEGVRCKHQLNRNSVKMYDKQESILRVETTINDARDIRVYRTRETAPDGQLKWLALRKGIADLHRRAEVSQKANERYLEAMATVDVQQPLGVTVREICQPTFWQGRRVRGLAPFTTHDASLVAAIMHGEFLLHGFRNRDLRVLLLGATPTDKKQLQRQSAKITRQIRLLRAHGLIRKITKTSRYELTTHGRQTLTALLAAQAASTQKLTTLAA
jgi:hypothetical protein